MTFLIVSKSTNSFLSESTPVKKGIVTSSFNGVPENSRSSESTPVKKGIVTIKYAGEKNMHLVGKHPV